MASFSRRRAIPLNWPTVERGGAWPPLSSWPRSVSPPGLALNALKKKFQPVRLCFPSDGMSLHVLRTPINITLRRFAHGSDAVSASWNFSLVGGHGGWQSDGCRILGHHDNFTTISCNSLGNYGLLMVGGPVTFVARRVEARRTSPADGLSLLLSHRTSAAWSFSLSAFGPCTRSSTPQLSCSCSACSPSSSATSTITGTR